jgi:hypothetical protein
MILIININKQTYGPGQNHFAELNQHVWEDCEFEDITLGLHVHLINPLWWKESVNKYLIFIQGGILSSVSHFGNSPFPIDTYAILLVGFNTIDT